MRTIREEVKGVMLPGKNERDSINILLGENQFFCETPRAWELWAPKPGYLKDMPHRIKRWSKGRVLALLINNAWEVQ